MSDYVSDHQIQTGLISFLKGKATITADTIDRTTGKLVRGNLLVSNFNNSANLQVLASTLNLNLGGTNNGAVSNALGATLNLGGGNHVFGATSSVNRKKHAR